MYEEIDKQQLAEYSRLIEQFLKINQNTCNAHISRRRGELIDFDLKHSESQVEGFMKQLKQAGLDVSFNSSEYGFSGFEYNGRFRERSVASDIVILKEKLNISAVQDQAKKSTRESRNILPAMNLQQEQAAEQPSNKQLLDEYTSQVTINSKKPVPHTP